MVVRDKRPTEKMVADAWFTNDDFGGVAWRVDGLVHWQKGIENVETMQQLIAELPMPFVAHFRIASSGPVVPELTHPMPIDEQVPLFLKGTTGGSVLFHNGTWHKWQDYSLDMTVHLRAENGGKIKIPKGPWNDTRTMAWAAAHYGPEVLNFIGEKCVVFGPTELEVFRKDWDLVNGVLCSNKHFDRSWHQTTGNGYNVNYPSSMCKMGSCTAKANLDKDGRCPKHSLIIPEVKMLLPGDDTLPVIDVKMADEDGKIPDVAQPGGAGAVDPFVQLQALRQLRCRHKLTRQEFDKRKKPFEEMIRTMTVVH